MMEMEADVVIVGAGIAGLSTALGLHRLGKRSIVLESSDRLRITGFALTLWTNAWRALDVLGIGDSLRLHSLQLRGFHVASPNSGYTNNSFKDNKRFANGEGRCVRRKQLLEMLEKELPQGTIRYSSKVTLISDSGNFRLIHLADGSILKTKVLIGCDGVNSIVAKWLGLQSPVSTGRSAIRGLVEYSEGHGFEPNVHIYFGEGVRCGFLPCDDKFLYWFCTFNPSDNQYKRVEEDPREMKEFVVSRLRNAPEEMVAVVDRTQLNCISCASLKFRLPWQLLVGNIAKENVSTAGDALHLMMPDIGQGGCSALEDGVVLARCLGEAFCEGHGDEFGRIKDGLAKYANERRWRSFTLISTAYMIGLIQQSDGLLIRFLRERCLGRYTVGFFFRMADFDFGKLK